MAPSQVDYTQQQQLEQQLSYTHKKFNTGCYKHKKFGQRSAKEATPTATPSTLFRPYALDENTPRKRRQQTEQVQQPQLPPTPPNTPPQLQHQQQFTQFYMPATPTPTLVSSPPAAPMLNHQAYALMLQKQRAVLQMRHMLSINPDANTWPAELRNALYSMLQH
ncbi:CG15480 [Drosophila busckii]|uniref:CG15480 n=1 Tax=Drosophila busckii TaxID=30019 RepID=A0A0M5J197_DROBS|nr:CG15480 [Drosophila busckii]